ncbi:uncharacterized protein H6S33_005601 [Morchella sextelata]|uniref:uncharacterized protein n=1 Tax=Morchella sextelata TaxID=1174677 RepID=UPI001D056A31|nr:uncharacterized protein H6S33_005601 [Morchella sextelata]KAH0613715.1 hypothetical protein H6S33_005601 [Morchella sextelata]
MVAVASRVYDTLGVSTFLPRSLVGSLAGGLDPPQASTTSTRSYKSACRCLFINRPSCQRHLEGPLSGDDAAVERCGCGARRGKD